MRTALALSLALLWLGGCPSPSPDEPTSPSPRALPVQQSHVYGEAVTGRFVSLIDFEAPASLDGAPPSGHGSDQLRHFAVNPLGSGQMRFVVNITRTGAAAMEADLPPGSSLIFLPPRVRDFSSYTLLSMAVHLPTVRDDLVVTLTSPSASWSSPPQLSPAGWSTVMIDLARLANQTERGSDNGFDLRRVQSVDLKFAAATEPVCMGLDDIMLIDNRRIIAGTPPSIMVAKDGLDYTIRLPGLEQPIVLAQDEDALWRLGAHQPLVQLVRPGEPLSEPGENLEVLGQRRVGTVELLEANAVRVRLANTWYFPPQAGQWIDLNVRQIRWEYTFYADGRWVTCLSVNNAGGDDLRGIRVSLPWEAGLSTGEVASEFTDADFVGPSGVWSMLTAGDVADADMLRENFAQPAMMKIRLGLSAASDQVDAGQAGVFAPGDLNRDGFDESQGCYFARSVGGNCRVELRPRETAGAAQTQPGREASEPIVRPVLVIAGPWKVDSSGQQRPGVSANCQGLPLRPIAVIPADGHAMDSSTAFPAGAGAMVDEIIRHPSVIEFTGPVGRLDQ